MAQESKLSTPVAILLGSVIISVGVFLGLRSKTDAPPAPIPAPVALPAQAPAPPPRIEVAPAPKPVDRSVVAKQVSVELEKQKKTIVDKCLAPSLATKPEPKNVKYMLNFSFDPSGKQLSRGIAEDRATSRPDVTQCVTSTLTTIVVEPPGQSVFVEVPFDLP